MAPDSCYRPYLPGEIISMIMELLTIKERWPASTVSRLWLDAFHSSRILDLKASSPLRQIGVDRIVRIFPGLQKLRIKLSNRSEYSISDIMELGASFRGHPALLWIEADTSAIIYGAMRCPRLNSLTIREDYPLQVFLKTEYLQGRQTL
jgi:hypothetical protein